MSTNDESATEILHAFADYGAVICSECQPEVSVARDTEEEQYA